MIIGWNEDVIFCAKKKFTSVNIQAQVKPARITSMLGTVILHGFFLTGNLEQKAEDQQGQAVQKQYVISEEKGAAKIQERRLR